MDTDVLRAALESIEADKAQVEEEIEKLRDRIDELEDRGAELEEAATALRELLGLPDPEENEDQLSLPGPSATGADQRSFPATTEAVFAFLQTNHEFMHKAKGIAAALQAAGLLDPNLKQPYGTVLEAAKRLADRHPNIRRIDRGKDVFFAYYEPEGGDAK